VVYYAFGVFVSYSMIGSYAWGVGIALLFSALLLPLLWVQAREGTRLDADGWTFSSTKGTAAFIVMITSWFPQFRLLDLTTSVITSLYFLVAGVTLGVCLYFQDYLRPIKGYASQEVELKALDLEHREVLALLTFTGASMMILFGAVFGGSVAAQLKTTLPGGARVPIAGLAKQVLIAMFAAVGFILWILRPFHARAREIRLRMRELSSLTSQRSSGPDQQESGTQSMIAQSE
jgi:hypothetical protein